MAPTHTTSSHHYTVACLTGSGVGPEVMAEGSRALAEVSALHGFRIDEIHPPFGDEALCRSGRPLPSSTLQAAREADAVLVAGSSQPAFEGVKTELDPSTLVVYSQLHGGRELTLFAPFGSGSEEWTIARGFESAKARAGRIASVGIDDVWRRRVERQAEEHAGVVVDHLTLAEAVRHLATSLRPLRADSPELMIVAPPIVDALLEVAQIGGGGHPAAVALMGHERPGLFCPMHDSGRDGGQGTAHDSAGQGVADPSEMLLAAALLLREGLGRHAAAATLEAGIACARRGPVGTPDRAESGSLASGTREFVDVVLGLLPGSRRDTEFALGGPA